MYAGNLFPYFVNLFLETVFKINGKTLFVMNMFYFKQTF